jgi:hypothetical protein
LALVFKLSTAARRLLVGRPFRSDRLSHTLLPKRIALPVFASDALPATESIRKTSSGAYATEDVPLKVIASPYREITRPVLDYVKRVSKESKRTVVTVFIPEYVVGHWWEQVLHNQSALRLKGRLLFMPGVMVTSVPWQLNSSERVNTFESHAAPGDARRGIFD